MSSNVFTSRIRAIQKTLKSGVFIFDHPIDILYLTGMKVSAGRVAIGKRSATFYLDSRYLEGAKKQSPIPVKPLAKFAAKKIYFDRDRASYRSYLELKKIGTPVGVASPLSDLRKIKDAGEIKKIKKSAKLLMEGYAYLKKQFKVGITEQELAMAFEVYVRKHGAERLSFTPIVAFGTNGAFPHHSSSKKKLKKGELILCDLGVVVDGYCSDMTRTHPFGKIPPKVAEIDAIVKSAHAKVLEHCKPKIPLEKLDAIARKEMGPLEKYFVHRLGHGIGLEVHEAPSFRGKVRLEEGMIITIEPGIYLPGVGGSRHEDMIVITKDGYTKLT